MTRNLATPTPELDQILMRSGYPVQDPEWLQSERTRRMETTRIKVCANCAAAFRVLADWFEARAVPRRA